MDFSQRTCEILSTWETPWGEYDGNITCEYVNCFNRPGHVEKTIPTRFCMQEILEETRPKSKDPFAATTMLDRLGVHRLGEVLPNQGTSGEFFDLQR